MGIVNRAIIAILIDSGMRASELIELCVNDVDGRSGIIKVKGKGSKERFTKISAKPRQHLWKYLLIRNIKAPQQETRFF